MACDARCASSGYGQRLEGSGPQRLFMVLPGTKVIPPSRRCQQEPCPPDLWQEVGGGRYTVVDETDSPGNTT
jgi:hypothetical protein